MKHIVFVIGNYKNGGVAMRSTNLANEFAKAGYICTLLVLGEIAKDLYFEHHENVKVVSLKQFISENSETPEIKCNRKRREKMIKFYKKLRYLKNLFPKSDRKIAATIKGLRRSNDLSDYVSVHCDSIYIPFGIAYFEAIYYAGFKNKIKIIYAERNAPELEFPKDESEKWRLFSLLKETKAAVLQTKNELEFFEGCLNNAVVINNPVKSNLPVPHNGERRKAVVNFCRVAHQKNLPLLIESFLKFKEKNPEYVLEIYGNTVVEEEENILRKLKQDVAALNAEKYIKFLPPRADVHSVVRDATMFVSSSDFEGLSNSMIEAMAIGLPCICTDCLGGGAREMITDGENGLLVPIKDSKALANAMDRMANDDALSKKCSENSAKVRGTHAVETIAKKWLEVINDI